MALHFSNLEIRSLTFLIGNYKIREISFCFSFVATSNQRHLDDLKRTRFKDAHVVREFWHERNQTKKDFLLLAKNATKFHELTRPYIVSLNTEKKFLSVLLDIIT
jgi:hypothetical protein